MIGYTEQLAMMVLSHCYEGSAFVLYMRGRRLYGVAAYKPKDEE